MWTHGGVVVFTLIIPFLLYVKINNPDLDPDPRLK